MKNLITSTTQFVARNFNKNIVMLSVLMLGFSFFAGPVQSSGDERHERSREESKIYGVIEKMPVNGFNGMWIINGNKVLVSDRTRIKEKHGRAVIGRYVEAEGVRNGDSFMANKIEVERSRESRSNDRRSSSKFYGTVEALPRTGLNGVWKIDGREVVVTRHTRIKEKYDNLRIGCSVEVKGRFSANAFIADKIEVESRRR